MLRLAVVVVAMLAASSARAEDDDTTIARRYYEAGEALFQTGRYEAAIQEFESARRIKSLNAFNYNIGICYERLGRRAPAIEAYRRYVSAEPPPADAAEIRVKIERLERELAAEPPAPVAPLARVVPTTTTPPPPAPRRRSHLAPILVGVGAVALLATGGGLYGSARADFDSLASRCAPRCPPSSWSGDPERATAGLALLGVGAALAVTDVVLWILDTRRDRRRARLELRPAPLGLAVGGAF